MDKRRKKILLVAFITVLIMDAVFVILPILNVKFHVKSFMIWPSMFCASSGLTFWAFMILAFGKAGEDFFVINDQNNINWKQAIGAIVLAIVGLISFLTFGTYLESIGYKFERLL